MFKTERDWAFFNPFFILIIIFENKARDFVSCILQSVFHLDGAICGAINCTWRELNPLFLFIPSLMDAFSATDEWKTQWETTISWTELYSQFFAGEYLISTAQDGTLL